MPKKKEKTATIGKIMVSRHFGSNEEMEFEDLEVQTFDSEPASVRASYGLTINLGKYESARVDAAVTLPCYPEEVEGAFQRAFSLAEDKVKEQVKEIEEYKRSRS